MSKQKPTLVTWRRCVRMEPGELDDEWFWVGWFPSEASQSTGIRLKPTRSQRKQSSNCRRVKSHEQVRANRSVFFERS